VVAGGAAMAPKVKVTRHFFFRVRDDRLETVMEMLAHGVQDPFAVHPLHYQDLMFFAAARRRQPDGSGGSLQVAKRCAQLGVPATSVDRNGQTALFYGAREGNLDCVLFLMDLGSDPNHLDVNHQTAVFYAVREGHTDVVEHFIARGARLDIIDNFGKSAKDYAPRYVIPKLQAMPKVPSNDTGEAPANDPPKKRVRRMDSSPSEVLAKGGEYYVCEPKLSEVVRLRDLELEFVADHANLFKDEPWHAKQKHADWCHLVNVITDEGEARGAIRSMVQGKSPNHSTLQCVHSPTGQVVGYLHTTHGDADLDVSHLKVDRQHQGRRLGGLLMAGSLRLAMLSGSKVDSLRLVVLQRNERAIALYHSLGFEEVKGMHKKIRTGAATVAWRRMVREVHEPLANLAAKWEARVRW
jgi:ribosomal protein S18 acetylase RimI-like enzyme